MADSLRLSLLTLAALSGLSDAHTQLRGIGAQAHDAAMGR